ncbi:MAG: tetratricopeptide repeat protein [Candidatus Cybelea sp.]
METAGRPHFGALLRQFRLDAGLTQQQLAERAKLSVEAISTLERGARTRPYRDTVSLLGRALGLSAERQALLRSAIGIPHATRQLERSEALNASLLRLVRPDAQVTPGHNLPAQLTSFLGRQREVAEIAALLHTHRFVTVVGAGGVGKTRVAVQTGSDVLDGCPDGVWLVDLAPLADQSLLASTILNALQLPSTTGSPSDAVIAYLKTRRLLLILDDCEHVIPRARDVAASIVQSCPSVRILTTSRQALEVPGERVYRLPSLAVPPDSCRTAQDALRYGAVALFVDRAVCVDAGFALSDDNAPTVADICRRLDGIPLAIELAAARVKVLAPQQIAERLDQRFRLLTGGDPRALPRHRTMTALIDWSYDLLTSREQRFFEMLSVFTDGCTLEAVTAVCGHDDNEDDITLIDLISSLVTKSLLVAEFGGNKQRYRLLESSRQYAFGKLVERGEQNEAAQRHALFYVELAERLERPFDTMPESAWLGQAKAELGNWRAALEWALGKRGQVILGQRLAVVRAVVWRSFTFAEGRRWVRAALDLVDDLTPPGLVAQLESAEADGALAQEPAMSLAMADRALARYRELGDVPGIAQAKYLVGGALVFLGRPADALPFLQEASEVARELSNYRLTANILQRMGWARCELGDFVGARDNFTDAFRLSEVLGATLLAASITQSLAENAFRAADPETALRLTADALATYRSMNFVEPCIATLSSMLAYLTALGRYDEARSYANEVLELARPMRLSLYVARALWHLASMATLRPQIDIGRPNEYAGAARLFGFVEAHFATRGIPQRYGLPFGYDRALSVLREAIGSDEVTYLMAAGATMTEDEAFAQAHALE